MATGVIPGDFTQIINDLGVSVSYEVVTRTTDSVTGDETDTFAVAAPQTVIFFLEETRYLWDKEGLLEVGDAYIIAPTTQGIKRYDRVTYGGKSYYIENTTRRVVAGVQMCDYGVLFEVKK